MRDLLIADGWWVCRAAGSLGDADLVALKQNLEPALIEVKSTARGPYHGFGPQDREDLSAAARVAGAEAWLCYWPPRKQPQWISESEWPASKRSPGEEKDGARDRD